MRVHNCLIITSSESRIELRPDEMHQFSGNLIVNEAFLGNWLEAIKEWRGVAKALADIDCSPADHSRTAMHEEVVG
jgi:hypothetical protein